MGYNLEYNTVEIRCAVYVIRNVHYAFFFSIGFSTFGNLRKQRNDVVEKSLLLRTGINYAATIKLIRGSRFAASKRFCRIRAIVIVRLELRSFRCKIVSIVFWQENNSFHLLPPRGGLFGRRRYLEE